MHTFGTAIPQRNDHSVIYDPLRDRLVIYGSHDDNSDYQVATLSLGERPLWTVLAPTGLVPGGRHGHSAVYDPIRDRMIVFGGTHVNFPNSYFDVQFCSLGGSPSWTHYFPGAEDYPEGRRNHSAVYDPVRDRMIVFGGLVGEGSDFRNEVWALNLSNGPIWEEITVSGAGPTPRAGHTTVYDPVGDRMIVFGGEDASARKNDMWSLSLAGTPVWTQIATSGTDPLPRKEQAALYDPPRHRMIVLDGIDGNSYFNDVLAVPLSGLATWATLARPGLPPSDFAEHAVVFDPSRERLVSFGGVGANPLGNETWFLDLTGTGSWEPLAPSGSLPAGRRGHTAIYDPAGDRMVVFGGWTGAANASDTWALSFSGIATWAELTPAGTPPAARQAHSAVYDPNRNQMLVFGGWDGTAGRRSDVWSLSLGGAPAWSQIVPAGTIPAARRDHSAVFDAARDRMAIFGGNGNLSNRSDTWFFTEAGGTPAWTSAAYSGPTPRHGHTATIDLARDRMVVHGGESFVLLNDAWSLPLSGTGPVTQLAATGHFPSTRAGHGSIVDPARDAMVVFGGAGADTWVLNWGSAGEPIADCTHAGWMVGFTPGTGTSATTAYGMTGAPDFNAVSLGLGGTVTFMLNRWVLDGDGADFVVYENGAALGAIDEVYQVEGSRDGYSYLPIGVGPGGKSYFDLASTDLDSIEFVRITDLPPQEAGTFAPALGADIDAIGGINCGGLTTGTGVDHGSSPGSRLAIDGAPNPFRGRIAIRYSVPGDQIAQVRVLDPAGRVVRQLARDSRGAGTFGVSWDGADSRGAPLPSGVYFLRLETERGSVTSKLVLLR